jgi:hypothetical protein
MLKTNPPITVVAIIVSILLHLSAADAAPYLRQIGRFTASGAIQPTGAGTFLDGAILRTPGGAAVDTIESDSPSFGIVTNAAGDIAYYRSCADCTPQSTAQIRYADGTKITVPMTDPIDFALTEDSGFIYLNGNERTLSLFAPRQTVAAQELNVADITGFFDLLGGRLYTLPALRLNDGTLIELHTDGIRREIANSPVFVMRSRFLPNGTLRFFGTDFGNPAVFDCPPGGNCALTVAPLASLLDLDEYGIRLLENPYSLSFGNGSRARSIECLAPKPAGAVENGVQSAALLGDSKILVVYNSGALGGAIYQVINSSTRKDSYCFTPRVRFLGSCAGLFAPSGADYTWTHRPSSLQSCKVEVTAVDDFGHAIKNALLEASGVAPSPRRQILRRSGKGKVSFRTQTTDYVLQLRLSAPGKRSYSTTVLVPGVNVLGQ